MLALFSMRKRATGKCRSWRPVQDLRTPRLVHPNSSDRTPGATGRSKLNPWELWKFLKNKSKMARSRVYQSRFFASKYSFCSIFRDLQDPLHLRTFASWKFADFRITLHFFREFLDFEKKMLNSLQKLSIFAAIFAEFCRNSVKLQKITAKLN